MKTKDVAINYKRITLILKQYRKKINKQKLNKENMTRKGHNQLQQLRLKITNNEVRKGKHYCISSSKHKIDKAMRILMNE